MIEVLPIRVLTDEDTPYFGAVNVSLAKLHRAGFPVAPGIVITAPNLKLKTTLEQYNFQTEEVFTQSLTLVAKEISKIPVPDIMMREIGKHKQYFLKGQKIKSVKDLWQNLLSIWLDQIKQRIWNSGFYPGITEGLEPQIVIFTNKIECFGTAFRDFIQDDVVINCNFNKPLPGDLKKIVELVNLANKKLFVPYDYLWIIDKGVKLAGLKLYTASPVDIGIPLTTSRFESNPPLNGGDNGEKWKDKQSRRSTVKVFFDLSSGLTIEKNIDGLYISSEKIFNLDKPRESFDEMVFRLVEGAVTFPDLPVLFKLADKPDGIRKVRGSLRLLHQKSLFDPVLSALDFARHKKGLNNVHVVVPFVRGTNELLEIKRGLSAKKLMRKNSLQIWMEVAVLENIVNLENYLEVGIDGVVLNLDELIAHFNGFDPLEEELALYKNEVDGLLKFLEDGIRLLHKSKIPFLAYGSLSFNSKILEFLVEKGVYGIVAERYEAHSAYDLLHQIEKRLVLRRS